LLEDNPAIWVLRDAPYRSGVDEKRQSMVSNFPTRYYSKLSPDE
jgi:hypothetical protein